MLSMNDDTVPQNDDVDDRPKMPGAESSFSVRACPIPEVCQIKNPSSNLS